MRSYLKEALDLENILLGIGVTEQKDLHSYSLTQLVEKYAKNYSVYGNLIKEEPKLTVSVDDFYLPTVFALSKDQQDAWDKIKTWVYSNDPYFVLRGYAGTGKTHLCKKLNELKVKCYLSAPTNKAAKVLGKAVGTMAKTTYSLLGLRMEQVEDKLILTQSESIPYFPKGSILVIDEASMCGYTLCRVVDEVREKYGLKILYVGDPAQLPPVGELRSPSWKVTDLEHCRSILTQVMRNDNQLLELATDIRECILNKDWISPLRSNHTDTGVWKWKTQDQFENKILSLVDSGFIDTKVIAWRNKTVDYYNNIIRKRLGFKDVFCINDILLLAEPVEKDGTLIMHTDDEVKITNISEGVVFVDGKEIKTWALQVIGDRELILTIPKDQGIVDGILNRKANVAKSFRDKNDRRKAWKEFWAAKSLFNKVRYGYSLTAHRSQGSTYHTVLVDQKDILANQNSREAYRCLYVACTRPSTNLHSY